MTVNSKERYYVHGDCHDQNDGQYFCAYCDLFLPDAHFHDGSHSGHYTRYESSLKGFNAKVKNGAPIDPPRNPFNLVA